MELRSQTGIGLNVPSEDYRVSGEQVPTHTFDVYTDVLTSPLTVIDGASFVTSTIRRLSVWETLLVTIAFALIAMLIGIRAAQVLSEHTVDITRSRSHDADRDPPEADSHIDVRSDDLRLDRPQPYEDVISVDTPPVFLSDEGRIVQVLVENGGRIKQHQITDETGWSKSKVSRILSRMCDDGTVEKITVGRENVITLPEERPDESIGSADADSPIP